MKQQLIKKDEEINALKQQILNKDKKIELNEESLKNKLKNRKEKNNTIQHKNIQILGADEISELEYLTEINSGNFGKVYKVAKKVIYALKVLKSQVSQIDFKRFLLEYEIMNFLDHPNILKAFGIFLSNAEQPPSILIEFCPMNIDEAIKNKMFNNIDLVFAIYQIAEGMKYVHFQNIIHRDLKPSNILVASDGTIKIGDFGISKLMSPEEQSMTCCIGTQNYMAPEIIDENENYNEKVDVYSFGVMLFYLISGGELPKIKMSDKLNGKKAKIPSYFTDLASKLINDCWSFEFNNRPSFEMIIREMEINNYSLIELSESEVNEVKEKVKMHKLKIPNYNDV